MTEYKKYMDFSAFNMGKSMLKEAILYIGEYYDMTKIQLKEVYNYCVLHATYTYCRENLNQLRRAVTRIYFDGIPE